MVFFNWNPFAKDRQTKLASTIRPREVTWRDDHVIIDVCGQTCPGYLLAINNAVAPLPPETRIKLLITYPPCGDDVGAWCKAKNIQLLDVSHGNDGKWVISLLK